MAKSPRRWIALLVVMVIVEAIYVFVVSAGKLLHWPTYMSYYDLLAEGFRAGHLYLQVLPSPELLAQTDPYASSSAPYWMGDLTLYKGRYFCYWGPLPGLLLAAVKTIFRISQPVGDQHLVFWFLSLSALCGALLLERMTRRLFPSPPSYLLMAGIFAFALGGPALHLLASTSIYMAAVIGAQAFLLLGLVFAADCIFVTESRAPRAWQLAAAGIAWAMALGCRISVTPTVALLVAVTAAILAYGHVPEPAAAAPGSRWSRAVRVLVWTGAPVAAGIILLLAYNKLRFDRWLDFGVERQLTDWKFRLSIRYFVPNLYSYLFRRFSFSCTFPYAIVPYLPRLAGPLPPWLPFQTGYMVPEPIVGLMVAAPITWLIPAALRGASRAVRPVFARAAAAAAPEAANQRSYLWYALSFTAMGTVTLLAPLGLYMATMRYLMDVAPGLLLLSNLGLWTLHTQARAGARRWVAGVALTLSAATIGVGLLLGYQGYTGHFERNNPELASRLERVLSLCSRAHD